MHCICTLICIIFVSWGVQYMKLHCKNNSFNDVVGTDKNQTIINVPHWTLCDNSFYYML